MEVIDVEEVIRNYLIAKRKALFASKENIKEVEKIKNDLNKKDLDRKNEAKVIEEKVKNKEYTVEKLSTENRELYGSVKPTEISKILKEVDKIEINPSLIQPIKEIKSLGKFKILLSLHSEVQAYINLNVISKDNN